jgi:hypothetical protein
VQAGSDCTGEANGTYSVSGTKRRRPVCVAFCVLVQCSQLHEQLGLCIDRLVADYRMKQVLLQMLLRVTAAVESLVQHMSASSVCAS